MRQLLVFIRKEFLHIFRDPRSMLVLLGMPVVQIILFGFAITNEIRDSNIAIVDYAKDEASRAIIQRIASSSYFRILSVLPGEQQVDDAMKQGKIKLAVIFQPNLADELKHQNKAQIRLVADASDPNNATTVLNYASSIIADYQQDVNKNVQLPMQIDTEIRMLYNPQLKGVYASVPGIMGLILMLISAMMTSIAIVKEKEIGTMEVLLVSPVKPWFIIISKMIPYFTISLVNIVTILLLSIFVIGLPIQGSIVVIFLASALYIFCSLALGLLISTVTSSQQVAMLISLMGLMLPVMLLSGYMFPVANMPVPLQIISNIVPAKWYIIIVKQIMIKGTGLLSIWRESLILAGMTAFFVALSIKRFKVRL